MIMQAVVETTEQVKIRYACMHAPIWRLPCELITAGDSAQGFCPLQ